MISAVESFSAQKAENEEEITDQQMVNAVANYEDRVMGEINQQDNVNMIPSPLQMIESITRQPQDFNDEAIIFQIRYPLRKSIYPDFFLSH